MLAAVTEKDDWNDGWSTARSRRQKKTTTKGTIQELHAVHVIDNEKITATSDSGVAVPAVPKDTLPNVPQSETCENKFYRAANGSQSEDLGGKRVTFKTKNGSAVDERQSRGRDEGVSVSEQGLSEEDKRLCLTKTEASDF